LCHYKDMTGIDIIGYIAYILCLIGWFFIVRRPLFGISLNFIGGTVTIIYGILLYAMPVIIFNIAWALIALRAFKQAWNKRDAS